MTQPSMDSLEFRGGCARILANKKHGLLDVAVELIREGRDEE